MKADTPYVSCRAVGGTASEGTLGHCGIRVRDSRTGVDATIQEIPDSHGKVQISVTGPTDPKTKAFTGSWVPVATPTGMTTQQFDAAVIKSAVVETRDVQGSVYEPEGQFNSNQFVFNVITQAGGHVPAAASAGFTFAPGICGGSGLSRGAGCY